MKPATDLTSGAVSRVLSFNAVIYLGSPLPTTSSDV